MQFFPSEVSSKPALQMHWKLPSVLTQRPLRHITPFIIHSSISKERKREDRCGWVYCFLYVFDLLQWYICTQKHSQIYQCRLVWWDFPGSPHGTCSGTIQVCWHSLHWCMDYSHTHPHLGEKKTKQQQLMRHPNTKNMLYIWADFSCQHRPTLVLSSLNWQKMAVQRMRLTVGLSQRHSVCLCASEITAWTQCVWACFLPIHSPRTSCL